MLASKVQKEAHRLHVPRRILMDEQKITDEERREFDKSFSDLHDCEKSHGKIVMIEACHGVTRCGYCHEIVDYAGWFENNLRRFT